MSMIKVLRNPLRYKVKSEIFEKKFQKGLDKLKIQRYNMNVKLSWIFKDLGEKVRKLKI
jgi:hypothetical protein